MDIFKTNVFWVLGGSVEKTYPQHTRNTPATHPQHTRNTPQPEISIPWGVTEVVEICETNVFCNMKALAVQL